MTPTLLRLVEPLIAVDCGPSHYIQRGFGGGYGGGIGISYLDGAGYGIGHAGGMGCGVQFGFGFVEGNGRGYPQT